ncbi:MAG: hypothetical protein O3B34_03260 [Bacteroidetes bacterium]|nr:hypothetical protein [Bacteroidota bacterium]
MASYQRRGYKKTTKEESVDSKIEDQSSQTAEVFSALDSGASKTEAWFRKNQNAILGLIVLVALIAVGSFAYNTFILEPKEKEAASELYYPQSYFEQSMQPGVARDSLLGLALNGAEGKYGFIDIVSEYNGTKAAKLAAYGAGMTYLKLGSYNEAIDYLSDFDADDALLGALAKGGIADAHAGLENYDKALTAYRSAIAHDTNEFTTPMFLRKAIFVAIQLQDNAKALEFAKRLKDEFGNSSEAIGVDALIGSLE